MKKVLLFLDYYGNGGIEKIIEQIDESLNTKYEFDILSFVNTSNNKKVRSILKNNHRNFFIRNIFGLPKLKRNIKHYDVIHIHAYNAFGLIYAKKLKKYGDKIIVHAHNSDIDNDFFKIKKLINNIIKKLYSKNYDLVAVSEKASLFCFGTSSQTIYNCIDYNKFRPNNYYKDYYKKELKLENKKIIGHIGRFEKQKNHDFIIDMFSELIKKDDSYCLILVGNGSKQEYIKNKTKKLGLHNVLFLNHRDDIDKLINVFDIFILPSLYEGFGIACIEAQVNDKIVLISNNIEKDIIINNNTYLLDLDINKWVNTILSVQKKEQILDNKLDISNFIDKIDKTYRE